MTIQLSEKHQEWLRRQVAAGAFTSLDEAVTAAVQRMMLDDGIDDDDLMWAKPLIEEGIAQLDGGQTHSHEDVFTHLESVIAKRR